MKEKSARIHGKNPYEKREIFIRTQESHDGQEIHGRRKIHEKDEILMRNGRFPSDFHDREIRERGETRDSHVLT